MAGAILESWVFWVVGDWTTLLICLLFERDPVSRRGGWGDVHEVVANPGGPAALFRGGPRDAGASLRDAFPIVPHRLER